MPDHRSAALLHREIQGVGVWVSAPDDGRAMAGAFDVDWRRHNVFPLFVRIENHSDGSVGVDRNLMTLARRQQQFSHLTPDAVSARHQFSAVGRYFAWSFGLFGIGIIPGLIDGSNAVSANRAIRDDVYDKSLVNRSLSPGQWTEGFLFFDVPEDTVPTSLALGIGGSDGRTIDFAFGSNGP